MNEGMGVVEATGKRSILLIAISAVLGLVGLSLAASGAWLIALGGSWYYLIAGLALLAIGILLVRRRPAALWLYAALLLGTMAWALWEAGLDFWALAPRGDVLAILGVVLVLPWVVRRLGSPKWPGPAWPLVASLALAGLVAVGAALGDPHDLQGSLPGPRAQALAESMPEFRSRTGPPMVDRGEGIAGRRSTRSRPRT